MVNRHGSEPLRASLQSKNARSKSVALCLKAANVYPRHSAKKLLRFLFLGMPPASQERRTLALSVNAPASNVETAPLRPVIRATSDLFHAAACRLVSQRTPDIEHAARRLVTASGKHGIDLSLVWMTMEPGMVRPLRRKVRQAALVVVGKGKAAMVFVSEPPPEGDANGDAVGIAERTACLNAALNYVAFTHPGDANIVQALPDPAESWAIAAFQRAGFISVGTLTYMRGSVADVEHRVSLYPHPPSSRWAGYTLCNYESLRSERGAARADAVFLAALDASYESTLDCPELCGLRASADVLESHRSTGKFDPRLWWVLLPDGSDPAGIQTPGACLLLNPCPEQRTIELVYIGLPPSTRGRGLGRALLSHGLQLACAGRAGWDVACAVDDRNAPARTLYESIGFAAFGKRAALVKPV